MLTGYACAKIVNAMLAEVDAKPIPPQMVYTYIKKGYIPSTEGRVSEEDLEAWATKYVAKRKVLAELEA